MRIHYLGPPNSFSEQAALKVAAHVGAAETSPAPNLEAIAQRVAGGTAGPRRVLGVLPYYNFLEGLVQESLDLTYEHGLVINAAVRIPIRFGLGGLPADERDEVLSHPKGLAQCSDYLARHLPQARLTAVASTSEAARLAAENPRTVAIATEAALRDHGLDVIADDVGNLRYGRPNFTDFFVVGVEDERAVLGLDADRTMLAITPPTDRPGLLADVLSLFAFVRLNFAKIHSRPALEDVSIDIEPQMFYVEIMTTPESDALMRALEMLSYRFAEIEGFTAAATTRIMGGFRIID